MATNRPKTKVNSDHITFKHLKKTLLSAALCVIALASCGGSESSSDDNSSSEETTEATSSANSETTLAPRTTVTPNTLAYSEFSTYAFANVHIDLVRDAMSVNYSNQVSDQDIISAAQNVCYELRTNGLDAWVTKVDSYKATDSTQDWNVRIRSTIGAANVFCHEFKEEMNNHPIVTRW